MEKLSNHTESTHVESLRDLYNDTKSQFPEFDEDMFLNKIQEVLSEDSIRTKSLKAEIKKDGLDFQITNFPLDDFTDAIGKCLSEIKVSEENVRTFLSKYI